MSDSKPYCCEKFTKIMNNPEEVYNRETTFVYVDGKWFTDFSDGEYGDIELSFCPFCGYDLSKLQKLTEVVSE